MVTQPKIIGELAVVALKAKDLPNREIVGKQDPFCVFRLGEEAKKTKTDYRGGQHPVWDDQVNLMVPEGKVKMRIQLFDEDAKREDLISETDIDISSVLKDGEQDGWFPLTYKGRKAGEIYLELTFYAARPPPRRQPTRYKGAGMRPHSYQAPPPMPNYPPSTGRPLPVAPSASSSTPIPGSVGPPPYIPPQHTQQVPNMATPHMPLQYAQSNQPYPQQQHQQQQHHHHQQQQHHHHQQQQQQHNGAYYRPPAPSTAQNNQQQPGFHGGYYPPGPPVASSTPSSGNQPLLSAPFRPGHSPQNSAPGNQGYPPQPYPPQGPSAQYGNFSTPLMANTDSVSFPTPQRNQAYPPHPSGSGAPPFGSAQYPPNPSPYPPTQHYNSQPYPPQHQH